MVAARAGHGHKCDQWPSALSGTRSASAWRVVPGSSAFGSAVGSCAKVGQWQVSLQLLHCMYSRLLAPGVILCSSAISACDKAEKWQISLDLLRYMILVQLRPNVISFNSGVSACEKLLGSLAEQFGSSSICYNTESKFYTILCVPIMVSHIRA
ncbi:unnamed protein product [Symbiodinium microadriaticum]|nr:unnamed protein product [Symbiodinium microadriaticum]